MASQGLSIRPSANRRAARSLSIIDKASPHTFIKPAKRINEGHHVRQFLSSKAYRDIGLFVMQLNIAMCPRKSPSGQVQTWQLDSDTQLPASVLKLQKLIGDINTIVDVVPPDTGPRRFGNVSFRKWVDILDLRKDELLQTYLPQVILDLNPSFSDGVSAIDEITPYLMGSFGSAQRLDYGTGHELSFLAFLGCIYKLGGFEKDDSGDGSLERGVVIGIIEPYLRIVRRLILTYTLEPAGSHGVWGLDDHSFLPYIFGSAQCCPAIKEGEPMPVEGNLPGSPRSADIIKKDIVDEERKHNMYFSAIGFINDVKTGPFWEHSRILFDISGIPAGWGKINKGMMKMYSAEVLSKYPVVQHFPFGSLFSWDQDLDTGPAPPIVHPDSRPAPTTRSLPTDNGLPDETSSSGTRAPWATPEMVRSDNRQPPPAVATMIADGRSQPTSEVAKAQQRLGMDRNKYHK